MLTAMKIHGAIDAEGRCRHWHSPLDVVANKCATCGEYFACALCHAELTDHEFGPMLADAPSVLCGACRTEMNYHAYSAVPACPTVGINLIPAAARMPGSIFS